MPCPESSLDGENELREKTAGGLWLHRIARGEINIRDGDRPKGIMRKHDRLDRLDGSVATTYLRINTCNTNQGDHAWRSRIALTQARSTQYGTVKKPSVDDDATATAS
jgi:hypothetical protein